MSWTLWPSEPWVQKPDVLEPLKLLETFDLWVILKPWNFASNPWPPSTLYTHRVHDPLGRPPSQSSGIWWNLPCSFTGIVSKNNIDTTWQQKLNYVVVLVESLDNLKNDSCYVRQDGCDAHIRIKTSVLLKMNIKPTSSKAQLVGQFIDAPFVP